MDNGKLVIEYNNTAKITEENKDQQLQKYRQIIQSLPNKSLSLSELQASNSCPSYPVTTDKNKNLYTGLVVGIIGGVILAGIIALLLSRKKKKVN